MPEIHRGSLTTNVVEILDRRNLQKIPVAGYTKLPETSTRKKKTKVAAGNPSRGKGRKPQGYSL